VALWGPHLGCSTLPAAVSGRLLTNRRLSPRGAE